MNICHLTQWIDGLFVNLKLIFILQKLFLVGISFCHRLLSDNSLFSLFQRSMQHSLVVRLFRDESIFTFLMISTVLEPLKGQSKFLNELKEINNNAIQTWLNY